MQWNMLIGSSLISYKWISKGNANFSHLGCLESYGIGDLTVFSGGKIASVPFSGMVLLGKGGKELG
jgi:hypothetical protein